MPVESESLEDVARRVFDPAAIHVAAADVLRLYIEAPVTLTEPPGGGAPMTYRSSFDASYQDAYNASNGGTSWIGAIGHLCFLDQLGQVVRPVGGPKDAGPSHVERALQYFSDLDADERAALYALRNCLAHDFGLAHSAESIRPERRQQLTHKFELRSSREHAVVELPQEPWDGTMSPAPTSAATTRVDIAGLSDLVDDVLAQVKRSHEAGELRLRPKKSIVVRRRFLFWQQEVSWLPDGEQP